MIPWDRQKMLEGDMADKEKEKEKDSGQFGAITKSFDQYEYVAVITPGATLLLGLALVAFEQFPWTSEKDIGVGLLGLFLIAAYVTGQFLRAIGDGLDWLLWKSLGGMPTDWVVQPKQSLLDDAQRAKLQSRLGSLLEQKVTLDDFSSQPEKWRGITRQIYAAVSAAQRSARIDAFNRSYGMMIGLTVALLVLGILCCTYHLFDLSWPDRARYVGALALALAALTLYRAYLFGKSYGRELMVQFLELPPKSTDDSTG
jgi:hypothetical protein